MFEKYNQEIKIFIKINLLFWLPVILVFVFFDFFAIYSGELWPVDLVVEKQIDNKDYIYGKELVDPNDYKYKYLGILRKEPQILVIGSSRVAQIREEMFNDEYSFYNAARVVTGLGDFVDLMELLPQDYKPEIIFLGVDVWWFGEKVEVKRELSQSLDKVEEIYRWQPHLHASRYLLRESLKDPSVLKRVIARKEDFGGQNTIGIHALEGNGYRSDGSRQYATYIQDMRNEHKYIDRDRVPIIDRVEKGLFPFEYFNNFDDERLDLLDEFLSWCEENNIVVIGLAVPFSDEVYNVLQNSDFHKELFSDFRTKVPALFKKHEFLFFDFSDFSVLGLNNLYMFDGMHSSETVMARILIEIFGPSNTDLLLEGRQILSDTLSEKVDDPLTTTLEINWQNN